MYGYTGTITSPNQGVGKGLLGILEERVLDGGGFLPNSIIKVIAGNIAPKVLNMKFVWDIYGPIDRQSENMSQLFNTQLKVLIKHMEFESTIIVPCTVYPFFSNLKSKVLKNSRVMRS